MMKTKKRVLAFLLSSALLAMQAAPTVYGTGGEPQPQPTSEVTEGVAQPDADVGTQQQEGQAGADTNVQQTDTNADAGQNDGQTDLQQEVEVVAAEDVIETKQLEGIGGLEDIVTPGFRLLALRGSSWTGTKYYDQLDANSQAVYNALYQEYKDGIKNGTLSITLPNPITYTASGTYTPGSNGQASLLQMGGLYYPNYVLDDQSALSAALIAGVKDAVSYALSALIHDEVELSWLVNTTPGYGASSYVLTNIGGTPAEGKADIQEAAKLCPTASETKELTYTCTTVSFTPSTDTVNNPNLTLTKAALDNAVTAAKAALEAAPYSITASSSAYDKAKAIHDYLCSTISYSNDTNSDYNQTVHSALIDKSTVCAGYGKAFKLLCEEYGLECHYVTGTGTNSNDRTEPHGWNLVKIDGAYYGVDVTWDDQDEQNSIYYDYFLAGSDTVAGSFGGGTFGKAHVASGNWSGDPSLSEFAYPPMSTAAYPKPATVGELTAAVSGSFTYNGKAYTPEPVVQADGATLKKDTDYTLAYTDNTNAGEATVTVTGKGTYDGKSSTAKFTIGKAELTISGAAIKTKTHDSTTDAEVESVSFTGLQNGESLALGTDYTANGVFDSAAAGDGKTVTVTVVLQNTTKANNYALRSGTYSLTGQSIREDGAVIVTWPTASAITYGQTLTSSILTGGSAKNKSGADVAGKFAWKTSTTKPDAGSNSQTVVFTPDDTATYQAVEGSVTVQVNKVDPTVTWPAASPITFGQTLASSAFSGGSTNGTFQWDDAAQKPGIVGSHSALVKFTPTDGANYNDLTQNIVVQVNKATPTVTAPTASPIVYGQSLASSILSGGSAQNPHDSSSVSGTWSWKNTLTVPLANGDYPAVFAPAAAASYNASEETSAAVTINAADPAITINAPTVQMRGKSVTVQVTTKNPHSAAAQAPVLESLTYQIGSAAPVTLTNNGSFTIPDTAAAGTTVTVTAKTQAEAGRYNAGTQTLTITVTDKQVVNDNVTLPADLDITYGQAVEPQPGTFTGTASGTGGFTYTYSKDGGAAFGELSTLTNASGYLPVGSYVLKAKYEDDTQTGEKTADFTVAPKSLTLTLDASAVTKTYDGTTAIVGGMPSIGISGGAVNDETPVLDLSKVVYVYDSKDAATGKTVLASGIALAADVVSQNYTVPATVSGSGAAIAPAALTITPTSGQTKKYGQADPVFTYMVAGLMGGDTLTGTLSRAAGENVGEYDYSLGTLSSGGNYTLTLSGTAPRFVVTKADALVITGSAIMVTGVPGYQVEVDLTKTRNFPAVPGGTPVFTVVGGVTYNGLTNVNLLSDKLVLSANNTANTFADTVRVNVTGMGNYADSVITVNVLYTTKTPVTITGLTVRSGLTYNGLPQAGYTGTPGNSNGYSGSYETRYAGRNATIYDSVDAPVNAGDYTVIVKVPDNNPTYIGHVEMDFAIAKKQLAWNASGLTATKSAGVAGEVKVYGTLALDGIVNNELSYTAPASLLTQGFSATTAGSYTVSVVSENGNWNFNPTAPANYLWPASFPTITATVQNVSLPPELSVDGTGSQYRIELQSGIIAVPASLQSNAALDTVAEIENELRTQLSASGGNAHNSTAIYDVTLMVSSDGGLTWTPATEANFPSNGRLTVTLPYPANTDSSYDFAAVHMFTTNAFGKTPGTTERLAVAKITTGIQFAVTGLSPIAVSWTKASASTYLPIVPTTPSATTPSASSGAGGTTAGGSTSGSNTSRLPIGSSASSYRGSEYAFWNEAAQKIRSAGSGYRVIANARGYDRMPVEVMTALRANPGVGLTINWNGGDPIVIPAGTALSEANRIYYPLSYLAGYYRQLAQQQNTSSYVSKDMPVTGGELTVTAPAIADEVITAAGLPDITDYRRGLAETPELAEQGIEQNIPGVYEREAVEATDSAEVTPQNSGISMSIVAVIIALAAVAAGVSGFWVYKRRQSEAE